MRISDWSSDVCSSDLAALPPPCHARGFRSPRSSTTATADWSGAALGLHVRRQETHVVGLAERDAELAQDRVCRGDVEVQVRHHVLPHVLAARTLAVPARAQADAHGLSTRLVAGVAGAHDLSRTS